MFALLRTRRYPEGDVGSSRHIPGERPACWVPWLAQRPWRPLVCPKGPRAPYFIRNRGINNNNNSESQPRVPGLEAGAAASIRQVGPRWGETCR